MNAGRAKKIRQAIGYDVAADNIMGRQYAWETGDRTFKTKDGKLKTVNNVRNNIVCVGIRKTYRDIKKKLNRGEALDAGQI